MERKGIDYRDIERKLRTIANKFATSDKRRKSPFKDKNFMTPNIATVSRLHNGIWFELSYGTGIFSDYILGVTLSDSNGNTFDDIEGVNIDRERGCCHEFSEVENLLNEAQDIKTSV